MREDTGVGLQGIFFCIYDKNDSSFTSVILYFHGFKIIIAVSFSDAASTVPKHFVFSYKSFGADRANMVNTP